MTSSTWPIIAAVAAAVAVTAGSAWISYWLDRRERERRNR